MYQLEQWDCLTPRGRGRAPAAPGQDSPPQDTSSGLFSGYVGADSDYEKMKAKGAIMVDFDRDNDLDLYYGYAQSHFFENENGFFTEIPEGGSTPPGPPITRSAPQRTARSKASPSQSAAKTAGASEKEAPQSVPNHTV